MDATSQACARFLQYPELELSNNLGGELDASRSSWSAELDSYRKRAGRTEDCSDSFGG